MRNYHMNNNSEMLNCSSVYLIKVCICLNNVKSINKQQPLGELNIHK